MMIAARNAFLMGGAKTPTARDYVQNGLIAMWDGIENAGLGVHDDNATVWKDLIGSRDLTCINVSWTDTMAEFSGNGYANKTESASTALSAENRTLEVVFRSTGNINNSDVVNIGTKDDASYHNFRMACGGYRSKIIAANGRGYSSPPMFVRNDSQISVGVTFSVMASDSNGSRLVGAYWNGVPAQTNGSEYWASGSLDETIGAGSTTRRFFTGFVGCVRCYERILTAAEVAANYAIDAARFGL